MLWRAWLPWLVRSCCLTLRCRVNRHGFAAALIRAAAPVEGSVVGVLVLGWGDHPEGGVQAPVVPPVDPAGGGVLDVGEGLAVGRCGRTGVRMHSVLYSPMIDSIRALS